MDVIAAYRDVGSYRGAAEICGTTHKTVRRIIEAHEAGGLPVRNGRGRNFDQVRGLVAQRVEKTSGRISAKRLLPQARSAVTRSSVDHGRSWSTTRTCSPLPRSRLPRHAGPTRLPPACQGHPPLRQWSALLRRGASHDTPCVNLMPRGRPKIVQRAPGRLRAWWGGRACCYASSARSLGSRRGRGCGRRGGGLCRLCGPRCRSSPPKGWRVGCCRRRW
jgi:hypothetical protein